LRARIYGDKSGVYKFAILRRRRPARDHNKDSQIGGTAPGLPQGDDEIMPCTHKSLMSVMPRDSDRKADIA
jgi:hypothetical protein